MNVLKQKSFWNNKDILELNLIKQNNFKAKTYLNNNILRKHILKANF